MRRLVDLAIEHARSGAGEAIVWDAGRLGYANLVRHAETVAASLKQAGLAVGARVAFLGSPGPAFLISQFATHLAGGVWFGLNPRYTAAELRHPMADAAPSLVVVDMDHDASALAEALSGIENSPRVQHLHALADLADVPGPLGAPTTTLPPEIALLVYTSGTTGTPKGAMLTHAGMVEAARLYDERYRHPGMRTLLNLPINHVGGLIDLTAPVILAGGTLITMRGFDPVGIPALMREERVTLLGQVPAMHLAIDAAAPFDPEDYPNLRHLVWSGAAMPRGWIEDRIDGPVELSTCYGQTECTGACTFTSPGASIDALADTVGAPAEDGLVRVDAPAGQPGEVLVRGPLLMAGYLGRPDATAETLTPKGWLRTGDLGILDGDGALRLVGRLKEMFKSGGYNVYPREVETVIEAHPAVAGAAVIGLSDPRWGEVGWAFVLAREPVGSDTLEAFTRERLANYKVPKRFVVARDLPLLPIGKIDKRALKAAALEGTYG